MKLRKKACLMLFFSALIFVISRAEAEAEAEAQAAAEADPQYGMGPIAPAPGPIYGRPEYNQDPMQPVFSRPNYNPDPGFSRPDFNNNFNANPDPGFSRPDYNFNGNPDPGFGRPDPNAVSPCQMTEECCGMESQNCCMKNEQKCYTVWDRKCDQDTNLYCPVQVRKYCKNVQIPDCRIKKEFEYRTFTTSQCKPIPGEKCFEYVAKVCGTEMNEQQENVSWENQKLKLTGQLEENKCVNVQTKDCTNQTLTETITVPVQVTKVKNETYTNCRMVPQRLGDRQVSITVMKPVSRQVCYDMPVPVCNQSPCANTGICETGTSPCSNNNFNTATVCPQPSGSGDNAVGGCEEVRQPVCSQNTPYCNLNYQQCCRMSSRRVCKQVIQRVPRQETQVIPGGIKWVKQCDPYTVPRTMIVTEYRKKDVSRVKYDCKPINKQECFKYVVPQYQVLTEQKNDQVTVKLPNCSPKTQTRKKCVQIPDLDTECRTSTIQKQIAINKIICDRMRNDQICHEIPVSVCQQTTVPNCRMVPRQVCQNVCSQTSYCNTCSDFVQQGPGFGSCPTATCGQYIGGSSGMNLNGTMMGGAGGGEIGQYPYGDNFRASLIEDDSILIDDVSN